MNRRALAFIAVGALGFVVQMTVLTALTLGSHWPAAPATALAVETAVLTNFFWHNRWTWRDRATGPGTRVRRLWRFHLTNGITSILGNVIVTVIGVGVFHVNAIAANIVAVILLSVANYVAADRRVFARRAVIAASPLLILSAAPAAAAELQPETVASWNRHVACVEAGLPEHDRDAPVLEPEGRMLDVPGGAIHEWRGSILIRGTTVGQVVDAVLSPSWKPLQEDVAESRVLERHGDRLRIALKLVRKLIVTVTYDTEHDVQYLRRSPSFVTSRSVATKIVETGGGDRGFLWRLNSYWRYRQVGDAVQVDLVSLSLSRKVPWLVKPIAQPIINRIGRETMSRTLDTVRRNAGSIPNHADIGAVREMQTGQTQSRRWLHCC